MDLEGTQKYLLIFLVNIGKVLDAYEMFPDWFGANKIDFLNDKNWETHNFSRVFWDIVKIFEKHVVILCSPDSNLSVQNGSWRYPEVSSHLLGKAWKSFGCTRDVFRSIWSQENRLFEWQKLRKNPFFPEFSEIQLKSSKNTWWSFAPQITI